MRTPRRASPRRHTGDPEGGDAMIKRWIMHTLKQSVGWEMLKARQEHIETIAGELLETVRGLTTQLQTYASTAETALHEARRLGEIVQGGFDAIARDLATRLDRGEFQAFRQEIDRRFADVIDQIRSVQLNQLELNRPDELTFRVANSTQSALRLSRSPNGELCFLPEGGPKPYKIAVVTLPKSGTYLMAEVLFELGYVNTHIQAWAFGLHDYRQRTLEQMVRDYLEFQVALPIEVSAPLVRKGQFWVGHFEAANCGAVLSDFRKIFMIRDLRFALVSYMRWLSRPGRGGEPADRWRHLSDTEEKFTAFFETHGRDYLRWCRDIVDWRTLGDVCVVRFEDITGLAGERAGVEVTTALAKFLDEGEAQVAAAIRQSVGRTTKTYSGRYSSLDDIWSERVQALFADAGGLELNRLLGYAYESPVRADAVR